MAYTTYGSDAARLLANKCAKGAYQRALLAGIESWSGATLKGRAKLWSSSYAASRTALLERLKKVDLDVVVTGGRASITPGRAYTIRAMLADGAMPMAERVEAVLCLP
jgi:hypothetical protein